MALWDSLTGISKKWRCPECKCLQETQCSQQEQPEALAPGKQLPKDMILPVLIT